jgi:hypothetical protein
MSFWLSSEEKHIHPGTITKEPFIFPALIVISWSSPMPVEVEGTLIDNTTIRLDQPLKPGEERVIVRLKRRPKSMTKLYAPEEYVLKLAEKDLEELY